MGVLIRQRVDHPLRAAFPSNSTRRTRSSVAAVASVCLLFHFKVSVLTLSFVPQPSHSRNLESQITIAVHDAKHIRSTFITSPRIDGTARVLMFSSFNQVRLVMARSRRRVAETPLRRCAACVRSPLFFVLPVVSLIVLLGSQVIHVSVDKPTEVQLHSPGPLGSPHEVDDPYAGEYEQLPPTAHAPPGVSPPAPVAWPTVSPQTKEVPRASPSLRASAAPLDDLTADTRTEHGPKPPLAKDDGSQSAARKPAASKPGRQQPSTTRAASAVRVVAIDPNMYKFLQAFPSLARLPQRYPIQDKFSVVMINYKRPNHLRWQMDRLSQSALVHRIYIRVNGGRSSVPQDVVSAANSNRKVRMVFSEKNSLNNRFLLPGDMETEWTLSIDDDMEVQVSELEWAFRVAQQHPAQVGCVAGDVRCRLHPLYARTMWQITGFFPRTIVKRSTGKYGYVVCGPRSFFLPLLCSHGEL